MKLIFYKPNTFHLCVFPFICSSNVLCIQQMKLQFSVWNQSSYTDIFFKNEIHFKRLLKDIIIITIFLQKYALKQQYKENLNIDKGVKNGYSQQWTVRPYPSLFNGWTREKWIYFLSDLTNL